MKTQLIQLINSIFKEKSNDIKSLVSSIISSKTVGALKEKKSEIAKAMFDSKKKIKVNESVLDDIQNIVNNNQFAKVKLNNDEVVDVDVSTANVILTIFNALDDDKKQKMLELLSSNAQNFLKVVDFSWKNVE